MRPHTVAEAAAVVDAVRGLAGRLPRASLGRRLVFAADEYYLLAGRPFPAGRRLRGLPHARGRHRHGPRLRARVRRRSADDGRPASAAGLLRLGRRRARPSGYRADAPRRDRLEPYRGRRVGAPSAHRRPPARAGRRPHRRLRRPGARRRCSRGSAAPTCGSSPSRTGSSAATSASTGLLVGEDLARVLAGRARGPPLPAARRLPVAGPLPRRHRRPPTCPGRSRSSPTDGAARLRAAPLAAEPA